MRWRTLVSSSLVLITLLTTTVPLVTAGEDSIPGRMCVVREKQCMCCASVDDVIQGIQYSSSGDSYGILRMIQTGKAGLLVKGTIVFLQGTAMVGGATLARVQVAGIKGWTWTKAECLLCK